MHYKESLVLLQSGAGLMHTLQRRASVITKWDRFTACIKKKVQCYYKVGQVCCIHYKKSLVLLQSVTGLLHAL